MAKMAVVGGLLIPDKQPFWLWLAGCLLSAAVLIAASGGSKPPPYICSPDKYAPKKAPYAGVFCFLLNMTEFSENFTLLLPFTALKSILITASAGQF